MPFKKTTLRKTVSFEIPQDHFVQILDYDSVNFREFDLPIISTVLDQIDGVSNTEYSGHYGSNIFADFEADEDGTYLQIEEFETVLEDMIEDVLRISTTFPELVASPRQNISELLLDDDERGHRRFLSFVYSGENVLVAAGSEPREVKLFFRSGDATRWVDRRMSQRAWEALEADRSRRSAHGFARKIISTSKDIPAVADWIQKSLPPEARIAGVDVRGHFLSEFLPAGRPVVSDPRFVAVDAGDDVGLAVTFSTDGSPGTIWLEGAARDQGLELVSKNSYLASRQLTSLLLGRLPDELDDTPRHGIPGPRPRGA